MNVSVGGAGAGAAPRKIILVVPTNRSRWPVDFGSNTEVVSLIRTGCGVSFFPVQLSRGCVTKLTGGWVNAMYDAPNVKRRYVLSIDGADLIIGVRLSRQDGDGAGSRGGFTSTPPAAQRKFIHDPVNFATSTCDSQ